MEIRVVLSFPFSLFFFCFWKSCCQESICTCLLGYVCKSPPLTSPRHNGRGHCACAFTSLSPLWGYRWGNWGTKWQNCTPGYPLTNRRVEGKLPDPSASQFPHLWNESLYQQGSAAGWLTFDRINSQTRASWQLLCVCSFKLTPSSAEPWRAASILLAHCTDEEPASVSILQPLGWVRPTVCFYK